MADIVVFNSVTLDGVMQAPGRPDEDRRGGFEHGGWGLPYADADQARIAGESMATAGALLLGRRTYEDFFSVWPQRTGNPYTEVLNASTKYVVSRTLREPLPWQNSVLLADGVEGVARLRSERGKDIVILGSGELIRSLIPLNLIDRYVLSITPLVLGSGRRLFADDGTMAGLRLINAEPTSMGVIVATYAPVKTQ
jgi:dihydrofolate reductase